MRVLRYLIDNLGSMILALLLGFAVWIAATLEVDPFVDRVLTNIPIVLSGQPEDTILFDPLAEEVSVEVRGPESVVSGLKVSDCGAGMDLSEVQPGVSTPVTVQVSCSNETVRIQSVAPQEQEVHLEALETITFGVTLEVDGQVATGYQASKPRIIPEEVSIYGATPFISQVVSVTSSIDIRGAKEDVSEQVLVTPRDIDGRLVAGVEWDPTEVEVQVRVRRKTGFKPDVEVVPDLLVTPAEGYRLGSVGVDPSVVTLKGPPSALDQLPGFVMTELISVTGATQDLVQHTPLTVPENIVVVDVNFVTVTVEVLPIQSSRTMTVPVTLLGVPTDWNATASPGDVDVILEGPDAVLSGLQAEDVQILLNLYDYPLGVHRVAPTVLAPAEVTVVSVIPETIEVVIEEPPDSTVPTNTLPFDDSQR